MKVALKFIADQMKAAGVDYHFQQNKKSKPVYPYFVGDLFPVNPTTEDGLKEYSLVLAGFNRKTTDNAGTLIELLDAADLIENQFPVVEGKTAMLGNEAVAVFFNGCQPMDSGDEQLQKVQITLTIKTWKGGN